MRLHFFIILPFILYSPILSIAARLDTATSKVGPEAIQISSRLPSRPPLKPNGIDHLATKDYHPKSSSRSLPALPVVTDWYIFFEKYLYVEPEQSAVDKLIVFYDALQTEAAARGDQNLFIPMTQFGKGNLRLDIQSDSALPWVFIQSFAQWMLTLTARGYPGLYTARVVNAATGLTVTISLQLLLFGMP